MDMDFAFVDYLYKRYPYTEARRRAFDFVFESLKLETSTAQEAELVIGYILEK